MKNLLTLLTCLVLTSSQLVFAQATVKATQKINDTQGGFSATLGNTDRFGDDITSIGDFNNDGIPDIAVGASRTDDGGTKRGAIYLLYLNTDGTVKSYDKISSTQGNFTGPLDDFDAFGISVENIGDINNDGVIDLAVGAERDDDGGDQTGSVWILMLNSNGTVKSQQKISLGNGGFTGPLNAGDIFGASLANIGDIDNDGINDLAVGAEVILTNSATSFSQKGAVWVLRLNSNGTVKGQQKINDSQGNLGVPLGSEDHFGHDITGIGDFDNDGIEDIAVGASRDNDGGSKRGAIYLLYLNNDGTVKSTKKISSTIGSITGLEDFDAFGRSVENIGDINRDGVTDLVVGAPRDDDGGNQTGSAYVVLLNSDGTVKGQTKISSGNSNFNGTLNSGDLFGSSVTGLGDLDNDGVLDVAIGAEVNFVAQNGGVTFSQKGAVWITRLLISTTGIKDEYNSKDLTIFPNPSSRQLTVRIPIEKGFIDNIEILNSIGQVFPVNNLNKNQSSIVIDLSELPSGQYFIRTTSKQSIYFGKFIKL